MKIENVTVDDAKELVRIYRPYVEETAISFEYEVPSAEEFACRIKNITSKYPYIKAVGDGMIVGYAYAGSFKDRKAYDRSVETTIYVKRDCKRKGIGKELYNELESWLKAMGILNMNACIAFTDAEDEYLNNDSFKFHSKMGFDMVGTFHKCGYKFGRWYDMVWMEKMLGEHIDNPDKIK